MFYTFDSTQSRNESGSERFKNKKGIFHSNNGGYLHTSKFYQAMDCFVLPSRYEGLPVVGVEAQAAGVPCVMADVVTPETKILESTAFVSPEESAMNWAMAVLESTSHYQKKDTSTELRKAGFDIEVEAKKLTDFYEELLK